MEPNREMQNHEGIEWRGQRRKSGKSGQKGGMGRGKGKAERVNWDINDVECDRFNEAV